MNQRVPKYLSLPDVNTPSHGNGRIHMIAAFIVMGLLFLPVEYLAGAHCAMAKQNQAEAPITSDTCCSSETASANTGPKENDPDASDAESDACSFADMASHSDHASHSDSDCTSCENCNCYFVPFSGHQDSANREAALQNFSQDLMVSHYEVPALRIISLKIMSGPAAPPLPLSVPAYLANQVFLN